MEVGQSINDMNFGQALDLLKDNRRVFRRGWNGSDMFLLLVDPYAGDQYSVVEKPGMVGTLFPHIVIKTTDNAMIPWTPSQIDVLANDWVEEAILAQPSDK